MTGVTIRPLRFSADVAAMRRFLEVLGLRSRVEAERGGWVDLVAGRGMVALHDAATSATGGQPGDTRLSFEADDVDDLRERLIAAGFDDATVWDEAYGRVLSVTAADAVTIWVDERSEDLYGYRLHDAVPDPRWSVTPLLSCADRPGWERFLATLGLADGVRYAPAAADCAVRLELATSERLADVMSRLTAAGFAPRREAGGFAVTDPDGQVLGVRG